MSASRPATNKRNSMTIDVLRHRRAAFAALLVGALGLAACGGSADGAGSGETPASQPSGVAGTGRTGIGAAAVGEIAQITGKTLQVQSSTEQTAVTYSAKTTFTTEKATSLAAVRVGTCVVATAANASTSASPVSSITATVVRIEPATDGRCGAPVGGAPTGGLGARPSDFPSGARPSGLQGAGGAFPSGAPGSGTRTSFGAAIAGKVTAVAGSTISVTMTGGRTTESSSSAPTTSTGTVHVTSSTKYTTTVATTHASLKVGRCAVVNGSTDSSGAVSATRIALSAKTNGSCLGVLGGGPNG
jgi:hypothetical protein